MPLPQQQDLELHDNTVSALQLVGPFPHHLQPQAIYIYTDGSYYPTQDTDLEDAFGMVVLAQDSNSDIIGIIGTLYHPIANAGFGCNDIDAPSSTTAEMAGLVWALIWLISRTDNVDAYIFIDSSIAAGLADKNYMPKVNYNLSMLAAYLLKIARLQRQCFIMTIKEHTGFKAHTGDPWNELADALAKIWCPSQLFMAATLS